VCGKLSPKLTIVIQFTVVAERQLAFDEWLVAAAEVNDRKPAMGECDRGAIVRV
jgi:hypothetical protein